MGGTSTGIHFPDDWKAFREKGNQAVEINGPAKGHLMIVGRPIDVVKVAANQPMSNSADRDRQGSRLPVQGPFWTEAVDSVGADVRSSGPR